MKFKTMVRVSRQQRKPAGFTLLELLLVMAILVVLAGLGTVAYTRIGSSANTKLCMVAIKEIKDQCIGYKLQNGAYPKTLQDLVTLPSGSTQAEWGGPYFQDGKLPKDPWKNDFQYSADEQMDKVSVTSKGPDGNVGTADDVPGKTGK